MRTLDDDEYARVWNNFDKKFSFCPSVEGPFPAITEPTDSITFLLAHDYDDTLIDELGNVLFQAFIECGYESKEVYYLDWQHQCYAITMNKNNGSRISGFPDGDYAILLSEDMQVGTFGHPWEYSICIFGKSFVQAIIKRKPAIFQKVIRNAGGYNVE
ncbi:DUF2716 domain-containing protein [Undibacterium sp. Ji50W]|uniref:DUF2716 domain-containing protein n=1 Tax=Undibacterium sp. Ji50W TaxID=3413041 RepID=UPI003BF288B3